jgi:hypothetical protein
MIFFVGQLVLFSVIFIYLNHDTGLFENTTLSPSRFFKLKLKIKLSKKGGLYFLSVYIFYRMLELTLNSIWCTFVTAHCLYVPIVKSIAFSRFTLYKKYKTKGKGYHEHGGRRECA